MEVHSKSGVFGLSSSLPPLVVRGGRPVCESVGKADLEVCESVGKADLEVCESVGKADLPPTYRLGPLWWH